MYPMWLEIFFRIPVKNAFTEGRKENKSQKDMLKIIQLVYNTGEKKIKNKSSQNKRRLKNVK